MQVVESSEHSQMSQKKKKKEEKIVKQRIISGAFCIVIVWSRNSNHVPRFLFLSPPVMSLMAFSYMGHWKFQAYTLPVNQLYKNKQNVSPNNSIKWPQMIESSCLGHKSTLDPNTWPREWKVLPDKHDHSRRQAQGKLHLVNAASDQCSWSKNSGSPEKIIMKRRKKCSTGRKQYEPALVLELKLEDEQELTKSERWWEPFQAKVADM